MDQQFRSAVKQSRDELANARRVNKIMLKRLSDEIRILGVAIRKALIADHPAAFIRTERAMTSDTCVCRLTASCHYISPGADLIREFVEARGWKVAMVGRVQRPAPYSDEITEFHLY